MTSFVMVNDDGISVADWDFDGPQTWKIYPVAPETKGTARAVFSLLVRSRLDAEAAVLLLDDMNKGINVSALSPFCKGKVSTDRDWDKLPQNGGNRFEAIAVNKTPATIERARSMESNHASETWQIVVNNDFKGTQRPVFSFVVRGTLEADLVLDTVKILNRSDRPNITQCPFFCKGKVASKKDVERFAGWFVETSNAEVLSDCGQHFND